MAFEFNENIGENDEYRGSNTDVVVPQNSVNHDEDARLKWKGHNCIVESIWGALMIQIAAI